MMDHELHEMYCCGGILADEMGLGKTWETIGLFLNNPVPTTFLLVPPVLQGQWSDALAQSEIPHTILTGASSVKKIRGTRVGIEVVLATYDRAVRSPLLANYTFDRIVADEGHVFRNVRTRRFQQLAEIEAPRRWLLTGTPVQNREADFRNLLTWLGACYDPAYDTLANIAQEVMLRRTVAEVREAVPAFPEAKPTHIIHAVTMPDGEERRIFDRLVCRFKVAVATHMENWLILELYLRIRQFLAHPQIYRDAMNKKYKVTDGSDSPWEDSASKMSKLAELLAGPKSPTLIFTTFKEEMNYAETACRAAGYRTWRICGGQGAAGIDAAIRKSREAAAGDNVAVLVQIQAGNAGINLQHLSRIVFLSSHWNPAIVDQAVGRSYRIGQTKAVEVHHILLADGAEKNLDRHMAGLHMRKRGIARGICRKLVCDSAVNVRTVFAELNAVCPDEVDRIGDMEEEAAE